MLYSKIAVIFKGWMNNEKVTMTLLVVYLIPLIKWLQNTASTDNYQLIAGTSLLFKLFGHVIMIIWGPGMRNGDLQFGF